MVRLSAALSPSFKLQWSEPDIETRALLKAELMQTQVDDVPTQDADPATPPPHKKSKLFSSVLYVYNYLYHNLILANKTEHKIGVHTFMNTFKKYLYFNMFSIHILVFLRLENIPI